MAIITMRTWKEGMKKVSLTKLQVELLNMSLKDAKTHVDELLDDKVIILNIKDGARANEFFKRATEIGVNCELELS